MKNLDFLTKIKHEKKLELVELSEQLSKSYTEKSRNCLLSAKLLFNANLYENSIGEAYYSMYNAVQSLFFICGIKCENHSAAALILKKLFMLDKIYLIFSSAKEERIDKQYYTNSTQTKPVTKESAESLIHIAEKFILDINHYKTALKLEDIDNIRKRFEKL